MLANGQDKQQMTNEQTHLGETTELLELWTQQLIKCLHTLEG